MPDSSGQVPSEFDVIVAGAGPSGSSCAASLGDKGYNVLLLDKAGFPRDKTCGDAISGKSLRMLQKLGITGKVADAPNAVINAITFSSPDGSVARIDVPSVGGKRRFAGYVCRREIFDNILFQNARSKRTVTAIENAEVAGLVYGEDKKNVVGVSVKAADGGLQEYYAKVVVGADGANSVVARSLGIQQNGDGHWCLGIRQYWKGVGGIGDSIELHFVDMAVPGYFWIFPSDGGLANVGLGMLVSDKKKKKIGSLQKLYEGIIANAPLFRERFAGAKPVSQLRGWNLPNASQKRKSYWPGCILVGDAASLVDPFTGEGIGNAMTSGAIAAGAIDEAFTYNDFSEKSLKRYWDTLWKEIGPEVDSSYDIQRRVKWKWLLNLVIRKAATKPEFREAIAGTLINPDSRNEYRSPLFYLKVFLP